MSRSCTVCQVESSHFVFQNKLVCLKCDDLLFDIEIECDEIEREKIDPPSLTDVLTGFKPIQTK